MREQKQLFSPPEHQGMVTISGKTVELFCRRVRVKGEEKVFWYADWGDVSIATACDSKEECIETVRVYLKRIALRRKRWHSDMPNHAETDEIK